MKSSPSTVPGQLSEGHDLVRRFLDRDVRSDPYPLLNLIRRSGPVWIRDGVLVLSSRSHCEAALLATETEMVPPGACPLPSARLQRLVGLAFDTAAVERLRPLVRTLVDDRLDSVAARGRLDAVTDLAYPVPMAVLCHLLGVPPGDALQLHRQVMALSPALDPHPALTGTDEPPRLAERLQAEASLDAYLAGVIRTRRRDQDGGGGLLSHLLRVEEGVERLSDAEIAAVCRYLLGSGYETTAGLVSGGILAMLRAPHELAALRRDPGHARHLVEEVLRLDPPVQVVQRRAEADLDVCGIPVPRGTVLVLLLAAAHRDPAVGPSPDVFAAGGPLSHLAFGAGLHQCLGAPLARLVASTVLTRFAQRILEPRFATGHPSYRSNTALRGLRALWVAADGFAGRDLPWQPGQPA
ncbi:cytochrome P450 [Streptomyces goshikiensis]|uniref:cytochrome P450 n=1 Tax=Streptomyces goshikiensis TaxID=1942 RepID=UPI00365F2022